METFHRMSNQVKELSSSSAKLGNKFPPPLGEAFKRLAQILRNSLLEILQEMHNEGLPHSEDRDFMRFWGNFRPILANVDKAMREVARASMLKAILLPSNLTQKIRDHTQKIEDHLHDGLKTNLSITKKMKDKIADISAQLRKVNEELTQKDDLAAKITTILRDHSSTYAPERPRGSVIDEVMDELARALGTDATSVRAEWERLKMDYTERFEVCADEKQRLEQFLMETLKYFDESSRCQACELKYFEATEEDVVLEFICPICREFMVGRNAPVVISTSGRTICQECSRKNPDDRCPITRVEWPDRQHIENHSLSALIDRWSKTFQVVTDARPRTRQLDEPSTSSELSVGVPVTVVQPGETEPGDLPSPGVVPGEDTEQIVGQHVNTLRTGKARPNEVPRILKELQVIAESLEGPESLLQKDAIPVICDLLNDTAPIVQQRAVDILNALTCDRGKANFSVKKRAQILTAFPDSALTGLVALLQQSGPAKVSAERTLINIVDEEVLAIITLTEMSGIVTAFYESFVTAEWAVSEELDGDSYNTKSLFVRGVNLLGGAFSSTSKRTGPAGEKDMAAALLRLVRQGHSKHFVEESLRAIHNMVRDDDQSPSSPNICRYLCENNAVRDLIRLIPKEGGLYAEQVFAILNKVATSEDHISRVRDHREIIGLLLPVLREANHADDVSKTGRLDEGTKLLHHCVTCLEDAGPEVDISSSFSVEDLRSLMSILRDRSLKGVSALNILSSMEKMFSCPESDYTLKVAFLREGGIASLTTLLGHPHSTVRVKESVAQLCGVISSSPHCRQEFVSQDGVGLLYNLLSDDSLECRYKAAKAARHLLSERKSLSERGISILPLEGFPCGSVVRLLEDDDCRDVATELLGEYAGRSDSSESSGKVEGDAIKLLLGIVQHAEKIHLRKKAAAVLLKFTERHAQAACLLTELDGVLPLVQHWEGQGNDGRTACVRLLVIFCKGNDDCKRAMLDRNVLKYLIDSLQRGSMNMRETVAEALVHLVKYEPGRKGVIHADFYREVIECMRTNAACQSSIHLLHALKIVVEGKADVTTVTALDGLIPIGKILAGQYQGKADALQVLLKFLDLDEDFTLTTDIMSSLCNMLRGYEDSESPEIRAVLKILRLSSTRHAMKLAIVDGGGVPLLIKVSRSESATSPVALEVLLNLSRKGEEPDPERFMNALVSREFAHFLVSFLKNSPENSDSAVDGMADLAVKIIRNLSLASSTATLWLAEEGVVKLLLGRISHALADADAATSPNVVKTAVICMGRFLDFKDGRTALKGHDGIAILLQVLSNTAGEEELSFCTTLLNKFAHGEDGHEQKEACRAILDAKPDVMICVRRIFDLGSPGPRHRAYHEACQLLVSLVNNGPQKDVFKRMRSEKIVAKLEGLRESCCREYADPLLQVLNFNGRLLGRRYSRGSQ